MSNLSISTTNKANQDISVDKDIPPSLSILSSIESELVPLAIKHNKCIASLSTLVENLKTIVAYLSKISTSTQSTSTQSTSFVLNPKINNLLQDIVHFLPSSEDDLSTALTQISNDHMAMVYIATLNRTIISLHNLIDNKMSNTLKIRS